MSGAGCSSLPPPALARCMAMTNMPFVGNVRQYDSEASWLTKVTFIDGLVKFDVANTIEQCGSDGQGCHKLFRAQNFNFPRRDEEPALTDKFCRPLDLFCSGFAAKSWRLTPSSSTDPLPWSPSFPCPWTGKRLSLQCWARQLPVLWKLSRGPSHT